MSLTVVGGSGAVDVASDLEVASPCVKSGDEGNTRNRAYRGIGSVLR